MSHNNYSFKNESLNYFFYFYEKYIKNNKYLIDL